jgi:collagenase-like PrtC family protease
VSILVDPIKKRALKLAVGYPVQEDPDAPSFVDVVREFRDHIAEVYFAWPGEASGRSPMGWDGAEQTAFEDALRQLASFGVKFDMLFNANCYGAEAFSSKLAERLTTLVERTQASAGLQIVTTTSPFIARLTKEHFPAIEVRASVNMRLGAVQAMQYVADVFDSFYLQREYNRDFERIAELKSWCDAHGKGLHLLANSGCLAHCSTQTFHDNLVAHEAELAGVENVPCETLACRTYLAHPDHLAAVLQSTWIRPEDLDRYTPYFDQVKLATRMHINPRLVISAYVRRRHRGNLLDLLEPGHHAAFKGKYLDNTRFPDDWFERVTGCAKKCHTCPYCQNVLGNVLCEGA